MEFFAPPSFCTSSRYLSPPPNRDPAALAPAAGLLRRELSGFPMLFRALAPPAEEVPKSSLGFGVGSLNVAKAMEFGLPACLKFPFMA